MSYSDNLVGIDLEVASTCNANCPVCIRRSYGNINDFSQQMRTLSEVKIMLKDVAHKLTTLNLCGNYGDPMTCAEILPICEWIKEQSPKVSIHIATNGGIGKPEHYRRLGEIGARITFGVDGCSTEINGLHRVNVDFEKVKRNMIEYTQGCGPTNYCGEWQYLLFNENVHELKDAVKLAKELGITRFYIRRPNGFGSKNYIPVFSFTGEFTHWLTPVQKEWETFLDKQFNLHDITEYKKLLNSLETMDHHKNDLLKLGDILDDHGNVLNPKNMIPNSIDPIPYPQHKNYTVKLSEVETDFLNSLDYQTCRAYNLSDSKDFSEENLYVFISYDNYLYPCCMVGSSVSRAKQRDYTGAPHINDLLNSMADIDYEELSVKNKSLKDVLETGVLHKTFFNGILEGNTNLFCKLTCGRCETKRSQHQVV